MYRRYSQTGNGSMPLSQINRNRIKNILILLLAAGLIATLVISLPQFKNQQETRALYIARIQKECEEAANKAQSLTHNGKADSERILAEIRSNLYAVRKLNEIYRSINGTALLDDSQVQSIQNTVDQYLDYMTTGMDAVVYQTTLQNALYDLRDTAYAIR